MGSAKGRVPVQRRQVISVLAAVVCALLSTALLAQTAFAAGEGNTLTVSIADESYLDDITSKKALVVDVYQVASAEYDAPNDTYNYTMIGDFSSLQRKLDDALKGTGDWTSLCDAVAAAAKGATPVAQGQVVVGPGAGSIRLADDGIYLVLARGGGEPVGSTDAHGTKYDYSFQASLVALPTKYDENGQMSGTIRTDHVYGDWHDETSIVLKWSMEPVEESDEPDKPTPDKPSKPTKKIVRTGDQDRLLPFYVAMAVSGGLFVVLAAKSLRERRNNRSK